MVIWKFTIRLIPPVTLQILELDITYLFEILHRILDWILLDLFTTIQQFRLLHFGTENACFDIPVIQQERITKHMPM